MSSTARRKLRRVRALGRRVTRGAARRVRVAAQRGTASVRGTAQAGRAWWITRTDPIRGENQRAGTGVWQPKQRGFRSADDKGAQIKGYASVSSVRLGGSIDFHVSVDPVADFTVSVYRLGYYAGTGARHLTTSPTLPGVTQAPPTTDPATGTIRCEWPASWRLDIPKGWTSGLYLAVFTTATGWRSYTPFVVRSPRKAELLVLLPFSTYQAYNLWPLDGRRGKSLYYGYDMSGVDEAPIDAAQPADGKLVHPERARAVSFERPYARNGLPNRFPYDQDFIWWVEREGYDVTYADSMDLHTGMIDPSHYTGLVFAGHDEYWSAPMRAAAEKAVERGTSLVFMTANNVYWHVRLEPSADGRNNRTVVCYKGDVDPAPDAFGGTSNWRKSAPAPGRPEHELLGVQYNGIVHEPAPLIVQSADHWFWSKSGVSEGEHIGMYVKGEADGFDPKLPAPANVRQTLLSESPYQLASGLTLIQNTSLYEAPSGAIVFVASTLDWPAALGREGEQDDRLQAATKNLLDRIVRGR